VYVPRQNCVARRFAKRLQQIDFANRFTIYITIKEFQCGPQFFGNHHEIHRANPLQG